MTNLFSDKFYETHSGEIFVESQCLFHEHAIANLFSSILSNLGYRPIGHLGREWERSIKKDFYKSRRLAVVSFADSFGLCGDSSRRPEQWFNRNSVVITDNHALFEPEYTIFQVPSSYFGIYNYVPANQSFAPQRRFGLSVNRYDLQRQLVLLEFLRQTGGVNSVLEKDYVNFNARPPYGDNHTLSDIQRAFSTTWNWSKNNLPQYRPFYEQAIDAIPIRNHSYSIEQVHVSVFLNLVLETYFDNDVIALSEKIFRALVTPAPWAVYAAPGTVKYLKSLGFDVLDDIVDHAYNDIPYDFFSNSNRKIIEYISSSLSNYENLQKMPLEELTARCHEAAQHNQALLSRMQQQWPVDLAAWLPSVIAAIR